MIDPDRFSLEQDGSQRYPNRGLSMASSNKRSRSSPSSRELW
jgi:hypothetical protein